MKIIILTIFASLVPNTMMQSLKCPTLKDQTSPSILIHEHIRLLQSAFSPSSSNNLIQLIYFSPAEENSNFELLVIFRYTNADNNTNTFIGISAKTNPKRSNISDLTYSILKFIETDSLPEVKSLLRIKDDKSTPYKCDDIKIAFGNFLIPKQNIKETGVINPIVGNRNTGKDINAPTNKPLQFQGDILFKNLDDEDDDDMPQVNLTHSNNTQSLKGVTKSSELSQKEDPVNRAHLQNNQLEIISVNETNLKIKPKTSNDKSGKSAKVLNSSTSNENQLPSIPTSASNQASVTPQNTSYLSKNSSKLHFEIPFIEKQPLLISSDKSKSLDEIKPTNPIPLKIETQIPKINEKIDSFISVQAKPVTNDNFFINNPKNTSATEVPAHFVSQNVQLPSKISTVVFKSKTPHFIEETNKNANSLNFNYDSPRNEYSSPSRKDKINSVRFINNSTNVLASESIIEEVPVIVRYPQSETSVVNEAYTYNQKNDITNFLISRPLTNNYEDTKTQAANNRYSQNSASEIEIVNDKMPSVSWISEGETKSKSLNSLQNPLSSTKYPTYSEIQGEISQVPSKPVLTNNQILKLPGDKNDSKQSEISNELINQQLVKIMEKKNQIELVKRLISEKVQKESDLLQKLYLVLKEKMRGEESRSSNINISKVRPTEYLVGNLQRKNSNSQASFEELSESSLSDAELNYYRNLSPRELLKIIEDKERVLKVVNKSNDFKDFYPRALPDQNLSNHLNQNRIVGPINNFDALSNQINTVIGPRYLKESNRRSP
jgi:hypothetical protein